LSRAHGVTADEYRQLVGLRPRHSLWAPDLVEAQSARLSARVAAEPRLRAGLAKGRALAQRGELQRMAQSRLAERPISLERERQLTVTGARLGSARAAAYLHRRSRRAIELGFADLTAYYQRRYRDERRRVDEIAAELGCAESAVRADLKRLGLAVLTGRARTARAGKRRAEIPPGNNKRYR
jgi:hypothetical protein